VAGRLCVHSLPSNGVNAVGSRGLMLAAGVTWLCALLHREWAGAAECCSHCE
jgi:hypothetical protein